MQRSDRTDGSLLRLLARVIAFSLPVVLVAALAEARFRAIPTSYHVKREGIQAAAPSVEILVLGTSTAMDGVQPKFFRAPGYNGGNFNQSIYYDHAILTRFLDSMPKLKLVFFFFDNRGLQYRFPDSAESWRQFFYSREYDFAPEDTSLDPYDVRFHSVFALFVPERRVECTLGACNYGDGIDKFGWAAAPVVGVDRGPAQVEADANAMHVENIRGNRALRLADLATLRARGIVAALVVPPVTHSYSSAIRPNMVAHLHEALAELGASPGVIVRDYFSNPRFVTDDFADSIHLNPSGAEKFSRMLDDEIVAKVFPAHDAAAAPR